MRSGPTTTPFSEQTEEYGVFNRRLEEAAAAAGFVHPFKWAAEHGVAEQSLRNLRTQQKAPGLSILRRLSHASGKSINWWLGESDGAEQQVPDEVRPLHATVDGFVRIPQYALQNQATSVLWPFPKKWVQNFSSDGVGLFVVAIEDDAMQETFNRGDIVLARETDDTIVKDGLYAVAMNDALVLRRIHARPNKALQVITDNPRYPDFDVVYTPDCGIKIVGVPVWFSREIL